ncbi:MAG: ABC transporter ATP-binding protein/permease [Clostridia bacterium]|nr:ABC transporter ATP-binding protein/permease [Clostridia bacterium]
MRIDKLVKSYRLKSEVVEALKGVSFDLPDKGMVFILGKSGCGKSTLLNVLSGLDSFDSGDIIYKGKSLKSLTKQELDSYRNTCCGFIFQEYNLIPELNVGENISLALDLQGEKDKESKISEALKRVDLAGYENRKVTELSGGQKQRIAIARSIVKDPEIIFADEPSGALDSETGASVFSLLKELSSEKLVIVVSHDRESAIKYGDRVIELSDGRVLSDTDKDYIEKESKKEQKAIRSKMPLRSALKIGCSNFKYHPIRLIATVFLAMIAFSFFGISLNPVVDDISTIMYSTMEKHGVEQSALFKQIETDEYTYSLLVKEQDRQEVISRAGVALAVKYCESGIENLGTLSEIPYYVSPQLFSCISLSEIDKCGFSLRGSLPKDNSEIAITSYTAELLIKSGIVVGNETLFYNTPQELLGKVLVVDGKLYTISGIIDTKLDAYKYADLKQAQGYSEALYGRFASEISYGAHNLLYVNQNGFDDESSFMPQSVVIRRDLFNQTVSKIEQLDVAKYNVCSLSNEDGIYLPKSYIAESLVGHSNFDTLKNLSDEHWSLYCGEYYQQALQNGFSGTIDAYYQTVFNTLTNSYGISSVDIYYSVLSDNKELFAPVDCSIESLAIDYNKAVKIKGYYDSDSLSASVLADEAVYDDIYSQIGGIYSHLVVMQNLMGRSAFSYYTTSSSGISYQLSNFVIETVKGMEDKIIALRSVMTYLSVAFAAFSIILLLNFMLCSVTEKSNTIGILKSLGCSNFNLIKIFVLEGLIVGVLVFGASIGGLALMGWFLSAYFSSVYGTVYVAVFGASPLVTLILFGTIIVFAVIGCILPIARLANLKPMEYLNKVI